MKELTYEAAMKQLEQIVDTLEEGSIPMEEAFKLYEEGTKLTAFCNSYLDKAEQKISTLDEKED